MVRVRKLGAMSKLRRVPALMVMAAVCIAATQGLLCRPLRAAVTVSIASALRAPERAALDMLTWRWMDLGPVALLTAAMLLIWLLFPDRFGTAGQVGRTDRPTAPPVQFS
jgi:hypothetical protein